MLPIVLVLLQLPAELQDERGWHPLDLDPRYSIQAGVQTSFRGQTDPSDPDQIQPLVTQLLRVGVTPSLLAAAGVGPGDYADALAGELASASNSLLDKNSAFDVSCCVEFRLEPQVGVVVLPDQLVTYPVAFITLADAERFIARMSDDERLRPVTAYLVATLADPMGDDTGDYHALGGYALAAYQRMIVLHDAPGSTYVHEFEHLNEVQGHWSLEAAIPPVDTDALQDRVMFAGGPNSGGRDLDEISAAECTYLRRDIQTEPRRSYVGDDAGAIRRQCHPGVGEEPPPGCQCRAVRRGSPLSCVPLAFILLGWNSLRRRRLGLRSDR